MRPSARYFLKAGRFVKPMSSQIPLDFQYRPDYSEDAYIVAPCDLDGFNMVMTGTWPNHCLSIVGEHGAGKTHLGHIWAKRKRGLVLDGQNAFEPNSNWQNKNIFLDNAQCASELSLFALINMAISGEIQSVLFASQDPPALWPAHLPDLRSRLKNVMTVSLASPDDDLLFEIVGKLFHDRGLVVADNVIHYVLAHADRSVASLARLVADLDAKSASDKVNISRAYVVKYLQASLL